MINNNILVLNREIAIPLKYVAIIQYDGTE